MCNRGHYGIAGLSLGTVYHASKDRGAFLLTGFQEFSEGQPAVYIWCPSDLISRNASLLRAASLVGKKYELLTANCEDYVNWIVTGHARSPQRESVAGAVILALLAILGLGL